MQELALDAVQSVTVEIPGGGREIDVKKYAKVQATFKQTTVDAFPAISS